MQRAGFLRDPVNTFDPLFFGISPARSAAHGSPAAPLARSRLGVDGRTPALVPGDLAGSKTGVYVGGFALDAMTILMSPLGRKLLDTHHAATAALDDHAGGAPVLRLRLPRPQRHHGHGLLVVAGRAALRLSGVCWPAMCDLAMAGGVNVMLSAEYPNHHEQGPFPGARRALQELRRQGRWLRARRGLRHCSPEEAR